MAGRRKGGDEEMPWPNNDVNDNTNDNGNGNRNDQDDDASYDNNHGHRFHTDDDNDHNDNNNATTTRSPFTMEPPVSRHVRRQQACLPDLEVPDFTVKETNTNFGEQRIRQSAIGAITQTTATAKINRASSVINQNAINLQTSVNMDNFQEQIDNITQTISIITWGKFNQS